MQTVKSLVVSLLVVVSINGKAQLQESKSFAHEVIVISDNDNYALNFSDGYYTNGLILGYNYINERGERRIKDYSSKVIRSLAIGQQIYTPSDIDASSDNLYDRPYAGWLFIRYSSSRFLANEVTVDFGAELGLSGAYSLAEPLQKWWHDVVKYKQPQGWHRQIANGIGINFSASVTKGWSITRYLDLTSTNSLQFGTHFQNASQDLSFRFGAINPIDNSAFKNSRLILNKDHSFSKSEHFLLTGVKLTTVLQNALIEGSSWPLESPHNENIHSQYTTYRIGWVSSIKAYTVKIIWHYMSPEVVGGTDHSFVRLFLSYRF